MPCRLPHTSGGASLFLPFRVKWLDWVDFVSLTRVTKRSVRRAHTGQIVETSVATPAHPVSARPACQPAAFSRSAGAEVAARPCPWPWARSRVLVPSAEMVKLSFHSGGLFLSWARWGGAGRG